MSWGKDMRKVVKIQKWIRSLHFHDRIFLMDWMRQWYEDMKEQEAIEAEEDPDRCSCRDDEINLYCTECF